MPLRSGDWEVDPSAAGSAMPSSAGLAESRCLSRRASKVFRSPHGSFAARHRPRSVGHAEAQENFCRGQEQRLAARGRTCSSTRPRQGQIVPDHRIPGTAKIGHAGQPRGQVDHGVSQCDCDVPSQWQLCRNVGGRLFRCCPSLPALFPLHLFSC